MKKFIYLFLISAVTLIGCSREYELQVDQPDFDVSTDRLDYHAGDTVRFDMSGTADLITFNSGEKGNIMMSFASQTRFGSQPNQLSVQVSTDYSGEPTEAAISAATWTNISSRFTFSTNTTLLASGSKSINDLVEPDRPLYIAFKYNGAASATPTQRNWWVNNLSLSSVLAGTSTGLVSQATADWKFINFASNATGAGWTKVADGRILFDPAGSTVASEGWAIARRIYPDSLTSTPAAIKAYIDARLEKYEYVFREPGTYTVTFTATNVTAHEQKTITRELVITILP